MKILGKISAIIVAGGSGRSSVDILLEDLEIKELPTLPHIKYSSMVAHNGTILLCGGLGNSDKCLKLDQGTWKQHSNLNVERAWHSAVTTQTATFIFGGIYSRTTFEYLPKDSSKWLMGKTRIPGGFESGSAIALKSEQEILLFGCQGGNFGRKRILKFNVNDHTFQELPSQLRIGRQGHRCAYIPNSKKNHDNRWL